MQHPNGMTLHALDGHRQMVDTREGPVSYLDVRPLRPPGPPGEHPSTGDQPVAVFVHGVGTSSALWRNVIAAVAPHRRCVALDLPLHGDTPAGPGQDFSLTGLARVVEAFLDALDLVDVDLVANDTGGAVAQIAAVHRAERLATLTLTNCETRGNAPPKAFRPTVMLARAGLLTPLLRGNAKHPTRARRFVYGPGYEKLERLPLDVVRAWVEPLLATRSTAREFQRWIASLHDGEDDLAAIDGDLRRLTVPTLLVWGTGDRFFDVRWAHQLRETIPGAVGVVEVPGARLFFPDERASELVPHLLEHWSARAPARPGG
jgi:pimeloyl-ACP methyl ester carboxylesterase